MSKIVGSPRGTWRELDLGMAVTAEYAFLIDGWPSMEDGILTVNFRLSRAEKAGMVQCFGGITHVYAFGHDPERSGFALTLLLFPKACDKGHRLSDVVDQYNSINVTNKVIASISVGGITVRGIVTGCEASVYDAELNIVQATLSGNILSTTSGAAK